MQTTSVTRPYVIALFLLAVLSIAASVFLTALIDSQENNAMMVNISGRQRMLSQQLALYSLQLATQSDKKAGSGLREEFHKTIDLFEDAHESLTRGKPVLGIAPPQPEALRALYFSAPHQLDDKMRDYIARLHKLLLTDQKSLNLRNKDLQYILEIASRDLLPLLDKAVQEYERHAKRDLARLHLFQQLALGVTLIALMLVGWFIFRPVARAVVRRTQELEQEKKKFEEIAQFPINNPNPLIQIGADGSVIYANPAAFSYYADLAEKKFDHPVLAGLGRYFECHDRLQNFTREVAYQDSIIHQTVTPAVTNGQPVLVLYCLDMTDIKKERERARLLEAAIVNAKDGVIITTADTGNPEIIYVNDAFTRMTGYEYEEVIGQTPRLLQGPDTDKKVLARLKQALGQGRPFHGELKNYTKDRIAYWLDINIAPVRDEKGKVTHFAAIERDITERKAFEKELTITKEAAEVASRAKGDFLANMSHELRTPMNGIIGLSELLMEMDLRTDQKELADAVNSSSRNLLFLLNDILDLSKIEAGELTLEEIPFDLRRVIRQTIDLLSPMASRKSIILESTINPIVPDHVMGDPARLQQILNNLVSNAIKFTEVGYVRLDMTSSRDRAGDHVLHIRVEDSGIGIPEDKRDIIFNKFTQADVSTARKYGGTGLGLAITRELVEMMGGRISFDSVHSKGTTFYVEIPIALANGESKGAATPQKPALTFDLSKKLMVVDDHPVNLLFMTKVLKKLGFQNVDEARSGKEALALFEKNDYDLIFMDCQMPEMDGFEASARIREMEDFANQTKIIAVTADAMKGARERCIDNGMNDYISKPVDVDKLKSVLSDWLGEGGNAIVSIPVPAVQGRTQDQPVMDWERLRMFTDGNPDEEINLIDVFVSYADESLQMLKQHVEETDSEDWKKAAHKLKGSAANLGAVVLSDTCKIAESAYQSPPETKQEILERILAAYAELAKVLKKEKAAA